MAEPSKHTGKSTALAAGRVAGPVAPAPVGVPDALEPVVFPEPEGAPPVAPAPASPLERRSDKSREKSRALVRPGEPRPDLFNGAPLIPGNPGNSGGKPGRSGRPPKDFIEWCASLIDDEQARAVFEARCRSGDIDVLKLAAAYAKGKPTERVEVVGQVAIIIGTGKLGVEADDDA